MMADRSHPVMPRPDWLSRAVVSGFLASVVMSIVFFLAFGFVRAFVATVPLNPERGGATLQRALDALVNNQVLDLASSSLYLAGALHVAMGVLWAVVYARIFEPRLSGPDWQRGVLFSLIPWVISLVVFLPAVGGGFFGWATGAGPFPAIGNLILHLVYGATLGLVYGPVGDIAADEFPSRGVTDRPEVIRAYERAGARGLVLGMVMGAVAGLLVAVSPGALSTDVPVVAVVSIGAIVGAAVGIVFGSIAGLTAGEAR